MRSGRAHGIRKALTGLAAGALATAALLGIFLLGALAGLPSVPFSVFEWLIRVLPGRLVIFGLETTLSVLEALGLSIKDASKATEQVLAVTGLFVAGWVAGLLFFMLIRTADEGRVRRYGLILGTAVGTFSLALVYVEGPARTAADSIGVALWVLVPFLLWGWGLARLYLLAYPPAAAAETGGEEAGGLAAAGAEAADAEAAASSAAEAGGVAGPQKGEPQEAPAGTVTAAPSTAEVVRLDRRRFLIQMGGLAAAIVVFGAELAEVLRTESGPTAQQPVKAPVPFPNADSPVKPVPGTRLEYTPVPDHYRVDINLSPPSIDADSWRLRVTGLVDRPLTLTLDQLTSRYPSTDQFVTLSCVSNPVGGPLIGTTLWSGPPFRDVLADTSPRPEARYAHLVSEDGFDETIDLEDIRSDPRIVLCHTWSGRPLPEEHGFPLRFYRPGRFGMKQPKWITDIELVADPSAGYWVDRGWSATAEMRTTSVIDVVATDGLIMRGGETFVPIGGIAHAGDLGVSRVEISVDDGPWTQAELRAPLSGLTWVIWRYEWPLAQGEHTFRVRAFDGQGRPQIAEDNPTYPSGATGIDAESAVVLGPG